MAIIYGYERFNNPTTKLVKLSEAVTGGVGATNNEGYTVTSGLGQKDVGSIIAVAKAGTASDTSTAPSSVAAGGTVKKFTGTTSGNWKANHYYVSTGTSWVDAGTTAPNGYYASVVDTKDDVDFSNGSFFLLAEIPVPADSTDYCFVGVMLPDRAAIDNLVPRRPLQNWAKQFYNLKTGGVK